MPKNAGRVNFLTNIMSGLEHLSYLFVLVNFVRIPWQFVVSIDGDEKNATVQWLTFAPLSTRGLSGRGTLR